MVLLKQTRDTEPASRKKDGYFIGQVSVMVNLSQKTIRDYEKMALLKPRRAPRTNNRIYSFFEVEQIRRITHLIHNEGFTLPCLRQILRLAPCWNIFDCEAKKRCPAYEYTDIPCYETRKIRGTLCSDSCEHCAVYISSLGTVEGS